MGKTVVHVMQRNDIDCGLACAAIIAGVEYERAAEADPLPDAERGLRVEEMKQVLSTLTKNDWRVSRRHYGKPFGELKVNGLHAVLIRKSKATLGHWIAYDGETVYDPELDEPCPAWAFDLLKWEVVRLLLPSGRPSASF